MIGSAVGHYRIVDKIGEGGMGVVYSALDTRLKRTVAIKVLRPEIATSAVRVARFEREAHLLAALSHPNIAAIHGLEEHNGQFLLVLEYVEGDTLSAIIAQGGVPLRRAVDIARQIASAIEEAHQKGIVHRDLKPGNVKVRPDGTVKVLDFGVAKVMADDLDGPTASEFQTREGTVVGTPAYMSPEQASGAPVGSATDVWAFGCVLFELLSGHKPFKGSTPAQVRAAVARGEPSWELLSADTPAPLRTLIRSCLEIEPRKRLHHMGDARLLLDSAVSDTGWSSPGFLRQVRRRIPRVWFLVAGVAAAAALAGVFVARFLVRSDQPYVMHLPLAPPFEHEPRLGFGPSVAVSPDGRAIVYALESGTTTMLFLKRLDEADARPIAGTQGARNPFFSPGGEWVGFYDDDDRTLKKLSIRGGEPVAILSTDFQGGAAWGPDDAIFFSSNAGLMRVSANGGTPDVVAAGEGAEMWPTLLPGGRVVLFSRLPGRGTFDDAEIVAVRLPRGEPKVVLKSAYFPHYAPTGHLIFVQADSVLAAPFNVNDLAVTGPAVTILKDLWISAWTGYADFAFSATGTLAYVSGGRRATQAMLVTVDRGGVEQPLLTDRRAYRVPRVSPDGRLIAMTLVDQQVDVWTFDVERKSLSRLTDSPSWDAYPLWQPGMPWLTFASMRDGVASIYRQELSTGLIEKLVGSDLPAYPRSWSTDGKLLAYEQEDAQGGTDIWIYSAETRTKKEFLSTPHNERNAEFSPDGNFIAYESGEDGDQMQVYVRPYPQLNPRIKISTGGGTSPRCTWPLA